MGSDNFKKRVHNNSAAIGIGKASLTTCLDHPVTAIMLKKRPRSTIRYTMATLLGITGIFSWSFFRVGNGRPGNPIMPPRAVFSGSDSPEQFSKNNVHIFLSDLNPMPKPIGSKPQLPSPCFIPRSQFLCEDAAVVSVLDYLCLRE